MSQLLKLLLSTQNNEVGGIITMEEGTEDLGGITTTGEGEDTKVIGGDTTIQVPGGGYHQSKKLHHYHHHHPKGMRTLMQSLRKPYLMTRGNMCLL